MKTRITFYKRTWCKIRYWQSLNDISDETLARYLGMSVRSLKNYDKDAQCVTMGSIDNFLYATNLDFEELLKM